MAESVRPPSSSPLSLPLTYRMTQGATEDTQTSASSPSILPLSPAPPSLTPSVPPSHATFRLFFPMNECHCGYIEQGVSGLDSRKGIPVLESKMSTQIKKCAMLIAVLLIMLTYILILAFHNCTLKFIYHSPFKYINSEIKHISYNIFNSILE